MDTWRLAEGLISGYLGPDGDPALAGVLTDQLAFWFQLDDRFDGGSPPAPVRWDVGDRDWHPLAALDAALWRHRPVWAWRERWRRSAVEVVRAMEAEAALDPGTDLLEYVALGSATSTVPHLFVTVGWYWDLPFDDPPTAALIRRLALEARLENDLRSVARDRAEGTWANAVLLLERAGVEDARGAIAAAHGRVAAGVDGALADPRVDAVARELGGRLRAAHAAFHAGATERYG